MLQSYQCCPEGHTVAGLWLGAEAGAGGWRRGEEAKGHCSVAQPITGHRELGRGGRAAVGAQAKNF